MNREQITTMLDGLDGATPGPWTHFYSFTRDVGSIAGVATEISNAKDCAHIARCDPDTIRALCTLALRGLELDAAVYLPPELPALRAENERLRTALEPFAEEIADVIYRGEFENSVFTGLSGHKNRLKVSDFRNARRELEMKPE